MRARLEQFASRAAARERKHYEMASPMGAIRHG
jgi:hypothetical protein